jgi:hypothetical protein
LETVFLIALERREVDAGDVTFFGIGTREDGFEEEGRFFGITNPWELPSWTFVSWALLYTELHSLSLFGEPSGEL